MAIMIKVPTIKSGWESLVKRIMQSGAEIKDERGSVTQELLNTVVKVKKPLDWESQRVTSGPEKNWISTLNSF